MKLCRECVAGSLGILLASFQHHPQPQKMTRQKHNHICHKPCKHNRPLIAQKPQRQPGCSALFLNIATLGRVRRYTCNIQIIAKADIDMTGTIKKQGLKRDQALFDQ